MACIVVIALWCVRTADDTAAYLLREKLARQQLSAELLGEVQREAERVITVAKSGGGVTADYFNQSSASVDTRIDELQSKLRGFRPDSDEQALLFAVDRKRHAYRAVRDELIQVNAAIHTLDVEKRLDSEMATALEDYASAIYKLQNHHSTQAEAAAIEVEQQFQLGRSRLAASGMLALAIGIWLSLRLARRTRDEAAARPACAASAQVSLRVASGRFVDSHLSNTVAPLPRPDSHRQITSVEVERVAKGVDDTHRIIVGNVVVEHYRK